jgi:DNA polymerase V
MGDPQKRIALVDCNNFYVSCERLFNPAWNRRPVVVLSNNDGCVVARSKEIKAMGIPMGVPYFQVKETLLREKAIVLSSNYALYGDLSFRVMETLRTFSPEVEVYSIDEAFLELENEDPASMRKRVLQWTGIPVSIGIGATKTLAKAAAELAKDQAEGVFEITDANLKSVLESLPAKEIWGIGSRLSERLLSKGVVSAYDFAFKPESWIQKEFGVVGLRIALELRGQKMIELSEVQEKRKSILYSRSFGRKVESLDELNEALSAYTSGAAVRLREQESRASAMEVYLYGKELHTVQKVHMTFPEPLDYTPDLILWAKAGLQVLFQEGSAYRKVGVLLMGLVDKQAHQCDLFESAPFSPKKQQLNSLVDQINKTRGKQSLSYLAAGASGKESEWKMKREKTTSSYTTDWNALRKV